MLGRPSVRSHVVTLHRAPAGKRLYEAVRKRQAEEVERLVAQPLCDVNCRDKEHNTPLHWAAVQASAG